MDTYQNAGPLKNGLNLKQAPRWSGELAKFTPLQNIEIEDLFNE